MTGTPILIANDFKMDTTTEQRASIVRKWEQSSQGMTLKEFAKSAQSSFGSDPYIMVYWCNMWLGIEADGYTHS